MFQSETKREMGPYLKLTAGLLLLVQAFHLASLQNSTDSPRRTIPQEWLREKPKNTAGSQNAEEDTNHPGYSAFGAIASFPEEEENVSGHNRDATDTADDQTAVTPTVLPSNVTTKQPKLPDATISPTNVTTEPTNSSQINMTGAEEESHNSTTTPQNSTTHLSAQNSTSFPDHTNHPDLQTTASAPESNATQESTTKPDTDRGLTKTTESAKTTTVTTTKPEVNKTSNSSSPSTTALPSKTRETNPTPTTTAAPITPEKANKTASGGTGIWSTFLCQESCFVCFPSSMT